MIWIVVTKRFRTRSAHACIAVLNGRLVRLSTEGKFDQRRQDNDHFLKGIVDGVPNRPEISTNGFTTRRALFLFRSALEAAAWSTWHPVCHRLPRSPASCTRSRAVSHATVLIYRKQHSLPLGPDGRRECCLQAVCTSRAQTYGARRGRARPLPSVSLVAARIICSLYTSTGLGRRATLD